MVGILLGWAVAVWAAVGEALRLAVPLGLALMVPVKEGVALIVAVGEGLEVWLRLAKVESGWGTPWRSAKARP